MEPDSTSREPSAQATAEAGAEPRSFAVTYARDPDRARLGVLPGRRVYLSVAAAAGLVVAVAVLPTLVQAGFGDDDDSTRKVPVALESPLPAPKDGDGKDKKKPQPTPSKAEKAKDSEDEEQASAPRQGPPPVQAGPPAGGPASGSDTDKGSVDQEEDDGGDGDGDGNEADQPRTTGGDPPKSATVSGPTGAITGLKAKCLDVANSGTANGTRVQIFACNGSGAQRWMMASDGTIRAFGKCLTVVGNSTNDGSAVVLWDCKSTIASQKWVYSQNQDIVNLQADKCLDVSNADSSNGTKIQIAWCSGNAAQKWYVPS